MRGDRSRWSLRFARLVVALSPALWAGSVQADPNDTLSPADAQLRADIQASVASPPQKYADEKDETKEASCAGLNGLHHRVVNRKGPIPPGLETPLASLRMLRCSRGCCTRCKPGAPCPRVTCDVLVQRFAEQAQSSEACRGKCAGAKQLAEDTSATFLDMIKECPRGDPDIQWAKSQMTVFIAPKDLVARILELLRAGTIESKDAVELLEKISALDDNGVRASALKQLAAMARTLADSRDELADERVRELFAAASALLSRRFSGGTLTNATQVLNGLQTEADVRRVVGLLTIARDLDDPGKLTDLNAAVALLLERHPELIVPKHVASMPVEERLRAIVSLLNNAQLEELDKSRDDLRFQRLVESRRALRLKVATTLDACSKSESNECKLSETLKIEFLKTLKGAWFQSADEVAVDDGVETAFVDAQAALGEGLSACASLGARPRSYAAFCSAGPFLGFIGLRVSVSDGKRLRATVYWTTRTINEVVEGCSARSKNRPCPAASAKLESAFAAATGADLARHTLRASGIANFGTSVFLEQPRPSRFADAWRKVGRPIALLGALGLMTGAVYATNTHPDSSSGDWLWRSGLGVFVIEIGVETWLYFE